MFEEVVYVDVMIEMSDFKGGRKRDGIKISIDDEEEDLDTEYDGGKGGRKQPYTAFNETRQKT